MDVRLWVHGVWMVVLICLFVVAECRRRGTGAGCLPHRPPDSASTVSTRNGFAALQPARLFFPVPVAVAIRRLGSLGMGSRAGAPPASSPAGCLARSESRRGDLSEWLAAARRARCVTVTEKFGCYSIRPRMRWAGWLRRRLRQKDRRRLSCCAGTRSIMPRGGAAASHRAAREGRGRASPTSRARARCYSESRQSWDYLIRRRCLRRRN